MKPIIESADATNPGQGMSINGGYLQKIFPLLPLIAAFALHLTGISIFVSAPLRLYFCISIALVLTTVLLGIGRNYSLERTNASKAFITLSICVAVGLGSVCTLDTLSMTQIHIIICAVPLMWAGIFAGYCLCGKTASTSFSKLLASLSAANVGMTILFVIWHTSGSSHVFGRPAPERFPYTFRIWDTTPVWNHMFLVFDSRWAQYEKGLCYRGYSPLYGVLHYALLKFLRWYGNIPYDTGIRLSALCYAALYAFAVPLCTASCMRFHPAQKARYLFWLCAPLPMLISIPDLWTGLLTMDGDNSFPLLSLSLYATTCFTSRLLTKPDRFTLLLCVTALAFFSALFPIMFSLVAPIMLLLSLWSANRIFLTSAAIVGCVSAGTLLLMFSFSWLADLTVSGSSLAARTGFSDGGIGVFGRAWGAFSQPRSQSHLRIYSFVWTGFYCAMAACIANCFVASRCSTANLIFLMLAPVILDTILFSQAHTIHPYLYDIPVAVLGTLSVYWIASSDDRCENCPTGFLRPWVALFFFAAFLGNMMTLRAFFLT